MVLKRKNKRLFFCLLFCLCIIIYFIYSTNSVEQSTNQVDGQEQKSKFHWPMVGFGTAALGSKQRESIKTAMEEGYRMIDTASDTGPWYKTESIIGSLLNNNNNQIENTYKREDFFLITKLHPQDHGTSHAEESIKKSLINLKTSYIDLYLIHFPECWSDICHEEPEGTWEDSWKVMEEYHKRGILKHLGVSNFRVNQLNKLWSVAKIKPFLVQNHFEFGRKPTDIIDFCEKNGIHFMSYSSLHVPPSISTPTENIGLNYMKSGTQVLLKWQLQNNISVIPRSTNPIHIKQNIDLFDFQLTPLELDQISLLKL